jgi:lipopolysaccharide/colanic/teichoic acid biosynthesis glycosyltransferase
MTGAKRLFDCVVAALGLLLLSPILLALGLVVALSMGRPVLFVQQRPGLRGTPFRLVKFRTMRDADDADGRPLHDAERLTATGRLLRATSLDELPELWNVLRGEMSLVGPRPLLMRYLDRYTPEQARRHEVRPGITGLVQIRGRNGLSWDEKFALDTWYVDHRSARVDAGILWGTLRAVLWRDGISAAGEATTHEFMGSPPVAAGQPTPPAAGPAR